MLALWQIILLGLGAFLSADILMCLMNGGRIVAKTSDGKRIRLRHFTRKHTVGMTVMAIVIGIFVGLAHYAPLAGATSETPELGPVWGCIFFVSMMILFVAVTLWFVSNVRRWSELLWFAILATFIMWAAQSAVHVMALWWESRVLSWIFFVVPWMIFVVAIGFPAFVLAMRFFHAGRGAVWRVIAVILAITTIASAIVIAACGNQIAGLPSKAKAVETKSTEKTMSAEPGQGQKKEAFWCVFYNDECQKNNNKDDDLNFGLNPYEKGMSAAKLAEIHRKVMLTDPANGTAAMCWLDKHVGTRYMGDKFYDEYAGKDDAAINAAKEKYVENEKLYKDTMSAFLAYMDMATVEIREVKGYLEDQMYMIPGRMSVRGIPDVAVFKSGEQGGHYLVYTFTIKNKVVEVPFRVECLFQPTNVTEYLKVTVKEKPSTTSSSGGSSNNPGGTGSSPNDPTSTPQDPTSPVVTPTQPSTQPATYNKDKSKSDNSGVNDNPGEGGDTNNGVGATTSTKDKSTNSDHITPSEYVQKIEELKDINSSQKTGKDDSTPSTKTPSNTKVDNNGAEANKPAAQAPREPEVAGDSSNQYWDGSGI